VWVEGKGAIRFLDADVSIAEGLVQVRTPTRVLVEGSAMVTLTAVEPEPAFAVSVRTPSGVVARSVGRRLEVSVRDGTVEWAQGGEHMQLHLPGRRGG
jgi:hypothetical protein